MKKIIFIIIALLCPLLSLGQDVLLLRNGTEMSVKVVEITESHVLYKISGGLETVVEVPHAEVFSITYANGEKETFREEARQQPEYPFPRVSRAYHVGDWFDEDGISGVVIKTTDQGRHGVIMSGTVYLGYWADVKHYGRGNGIKTNMIDELDGWNNMRVLDNIIRNTSLSWDNFHAFRTCRNLGNGWYVPAYEESFLIFNVLEDNEVKKDAKSIRKAIRKVNDVLSEMGIQKTYTGDDYMTSTEADSDTFFRMTMDKNGHRERGDKSLGGCFRAFHKY